MSDDQRDAIAQALVDQSNTGGLSQQDFNVFSSKVSGPELQAWLAAGGVQGQYGGAVPDPDEQYFGNRGPLSGSTPETSWMYSLQPWQQGGMGGGETTYQSQQMIQPGFIGAGGAMRADPAYWGYQGRGQGYAPGSMGDVSGFNAGRGGGARGGTGGLTPQDFATFSRLVGPQALQDWLNAGGVQGQFGGGMGGAVGGGGGGGGPGDGGGGGGYGGGGGGYGGGGGGRGGGGGISASGGAAAGAQGTPGYGYGYGPAGTPSADGVNSIGGSSVAGWGGLGSSGFGNTANSTMGISGYGSATIGAAADAYGNPNFGGATPGTVGGDFGGSASEGWGGF